MMSRNSKRSGDESFRDLTASKKRRRKSGHKDIDDGSLLVETLRTHQFFLHTADNPNLLNVDQAVFLKSFTRDVSTHLHYPNNIDEMLTTLYEYLEDTTFLRKCLNSTRTSPDCDSARSEFQDNFIRLLFCVPDLQTKLISHMLDILSDVSTNEDLPTQRSQKKTMTSLPRLILSCLRFLPRLEDSHGTADKLMDILHNCATEVQREIILSLPEILEDSQHERIALALKEMLDESRSLTCTILDTLSNITISEALTLQVVNTVLKRLDRVDLNDLPSVVDFVLESIQNSEDAVKIDILQELRDNLNMATPPPREDLRSQIRRGESKDVQSIVIENIRMNSLINKPICDAWLKIIENVNDADMHKCLDIHILMELVEIRKKTVETIFKNKIRRGLFTDELFSEAVRDYSSVLKKYFKNLMTVCDSLLASGEAAVSSFASNMYIRTFLSLGHGYQQEIISDLICKVGTGGGGSITQGALTTLEMLANEHSNQLVPFTPFLTGMCDFITENMKLAQFRQLMNIFCAISWCSSGEVEDVEECRSVETEMNIMLKKQLSSKSLDLKKRGVVGVVCAVRAMAKKINTTALGSVSVIEGSSSSTDPLAAAALKLIDTAIRETAKYPEAAGLFMDELASPTLVSSLPIQIAKACDEKFRSDFENNLVDDYKGEESERLGLMLPLKHMLRISKVSAEDSLDPADDPENDPVYDIFIPIAKWVLQSKDSVSAHKRDMLRFIPLFRLLAAMNSRAEENCVDELLGCGVLLVPESYMNGEETLNHKEVEGLCDVIFMTLNWMRELVNFFCLSDDAEEQELVLVRLKNIVHLENRLKINLIATNGYRPPTVLFYDSTDDWQPLNQQDKSKKGKGGAGKGKSSKGKGKENKMMNSSSVAINSQDTQSQVVVSTAPVASSTLIGQSVLKAGSTESVDLKHFRPFFRELDLNILNVFNWSVVTTEAAPQYEEERLNPKLRPDELFFLLKDIAIKVDKKLSSSKKGGFPVLGFNSASFGLTNLMALDEKHVARKVGTFLPKLFANLDVMYEYFAELVQLNDGMMDCANLYTAQSQLHANCLKYGFDIAVTFFSWNGFNVSENMVVLKNTLLLLVERVEGDLDQDVDLSVLVHKTVQYLLSFTEKIVRSEVACSFLTLLDCLCKISNTNNNRQALLTTATTFIKTNWYNAQDREKGTAYNNQVCKMWRFYLEYSEQLLETMLEVFTEGLEDVFQNSGKDYCSSRYPTITRGTLSQIYVVSLQYLANIIKTYTYGVTKDKDELLNAWILTTDILHSITSPLKLWRNKPILKAVLKYSKPIIDQFLKHGMPLLEAVFKKNHAECMSVIKKLQLSTKYMHVICTSTKLDSDISLANFVPLLKKSLEATVYRVEAMLAANNLSDAFWLGNLKNKDLEGEEILSQETQEEEEEEGEADEEQNDENDEHNDEGEEEVELNDDTDPRSVNYDDD